MTTGVYTIVCTKTGEEYIGSSTGIEYRWAEHIRDLNRRRHHCAKLQDRWDRHGESAFSFTVIEALICRSVTKAFERKLAAAEQNHLDSLFLRGLALNTRSKTTASFGGGNRRWTDDQAVSLHQRGYKPSVIARKLSADYRVVMDALRRNDINTERPWKDADAIALYAAGHTLLATSNKLNTSVNTLKKILKRNGVSIRMKRAQEHSRPVVGFSKTGARVEFDYPAQAANVFGVKNSVIHVALYEGSAAVGFRWYFLDEEPNNPMTRTLKWIPETGNMIMREAKTYDTKSAAEDALAAYHLRRQGVPPL